MFSKVDHLAMLHGSLFWVLVEMCFKHKKGSFLFSQIKTLKIAEFKHMTKCFILIEIANSVIESIYKTAVQNHFWSAYHGRK